MTTPPQPSDHPPASRRDPDPQAYGPDRPFPAPTGPTTPTGPAALAGTAEGLPAVLVRADRTGVSRLPVGLRVPMPRVAAPATPPQPVGQRTGGWRGRRTLQVTAAVVVVLLAGSVVAWMRAAAGPPPRQQVEELFAALTAGDGAGLAVTGRCAGNPLCGADALRAGFRGPEQVRVDDDDAGPAGGGRSGRVVAVSYTLDGHRHRAEVGFAQQSGGVFGGRWTMTTPPGGRIEFRNPARSTLTLAGIDKPLTGPDPAQPVTVWAPPGIYTLTAPGSALFEPHRSTVTVTGTTDPAPLTLTPTLRPSVAVDVDRQVRERIDACAAQPSFTPDADQRALHLRSCPFEHRSRHAFTEPPRWSVDRYPRVEPHAADDGTVTVTTTEPGRVTVRYRWTDEVIEPREWIPVTASVDITVGGRVTAENGAAVWLP